MRTQKVVRQHGWRRWVRIINRAYDLASYSFGSGERILLDTNIWLYLYPVSEGSKASFARRYVGAFWRLIEAQAQPVLDPMVLSEYLNAYCRIVWRREFRSRYSSFKRFRQSKDFREVGLTAYADAMEILDVCQVHSISADELDLKQALEDFESARVDFNDALLVDVCKKQNLKLMTHDGDFQSGGIEVLTINRHLLEACP